MQGNHLVGSVVKWLRILLPYKPPSYYLICTIATYFLILNDLFIVWTNFQLNCKFGFKGKGVIL